MFEFGTAWLAMAIAFGLHVVDEAATDFLSWYNPTARRIRSHLGGLPFPPVFTFRPWLLGLSAVTAILFALSPSALAWGLGLYLVDKKVSPSLRLQLVVLCASSATVLQASGLKV